MNQKLLLDSQFNHSIVICKEIKIVQIVNLYSLLLLRLFILENLFPNSYQLKNINFLDF